MVPGWHPLVVHFPIALTLTAGACLMAARLARSEPLAETLATIGTWNLCAGAVAALFALGTGLAGVLDLQVGAAARAAISAHVKWAMFTSMALLLTSVWRGAGSAARSRPSWLFVVVLSTICVALATTGVLRRRERVPIRRGGGAHELNERRPAAAQRGGPNAARSSCRQDREASKSRAMSIHSRRPDVQGVVRIHRLGQTVAQRGAGELSAKGPEHPVEYDQHAAKITV